MSESEAFVLYHIEHIVHIEAHSITTMCSYMFYTPYPDAAAQTLRSGQVWTSVVKNSIINDPTFNFQFLAFNYPKSLQSAPPLLAQASPSGPVNALFPPG